MLGLVQTIPEGFPPGSDTAIMSIFGCDPARYFSGRAPLELAASGGTMPEGSACYRCNMVTLGGDESLPFGEKTMVSHSAGSIEGEESDELIEWLFSHEEFRSMAGAAGMSVRPGSSFRHLAVQENADLTGIVLAPPHDHLNEKIGPILPAGNNNAKTLLALMEKANELLEHHPINEKRRAEGRLPANGIWFWAEGKGARLAQLHAALRRRRRRDLRRAALPRHSRARRAGAHIRPHRHRRVGTPTTRPRPGPPWTCSAATILPPSISRAPTRPRTTTTWSTRYTASSASPSACSSPCARSSGPAARTSAC